MITVGIRDLKARLSEYLRAVRSGEEVVVTDRGRPVARLIAETSGSSSTARRLAALAASGLVSLPSRPRPQSEATPVAVGGRAVSELVREDRR